VETPSTEGVVRVVLRGVAEIEYRAPRMRGFLTLLALLASGCSGSVSTEALPDTNVGSTAQGDEAPPAMAFFAHPMLRSVDLSPDGTWVAGVAATGKKELLTVRKQAGGVLRAIATVVRDSRTTGMTISKIAWPSDDRVLMVVEEPSVYAYNNARRSRIFSVDVTGNVTPLLEDWRTATPIWDQGNIVSLLPQDPKRFLLGVRFGGERYPGVYRVDASTGRYVTIEPPRWGVVDWHADHQGALRAADGFYKPRHSKREDELTWAFFARSSGDQPLDAVAEWTFSEGASMTFAAFTPDPNLVYVVAARESDRLGVYLFDLSARTLEEERYLHPVVDVSTVVASPYDGRPLYIVYVDERPELIFLDARRRACPVESRTARGKHAGARADDSV
jgi:dipeptidyl aminopeptidase/acylaminoacyl peptidase